MRTLIKSCLLSLSVATIFSAVANADDISVGNPAYGGTGCPAGTASVTLSPDQKALSILFDQYQSEAGGDTRKFMDRKSCNLAIPVHVPHGFSISVFQVDYRGFVAIPTGGRGQFGVEYFFAGMQGPRSTKNFGPGSQNYEMTDVLNAQSVIWSPCGADTNLRVNTSLLVQSNSAMNQAIATVDSADVTAGLVYHIEWRRCN